MRRLARTGWALLIIISFLTHLLLPGVAPVSAATATPTFSGYAKIDGPLQLEISIAPPVTRPGTQLTLDLRLTNHLPDPAEPAVLVTLPPHLALAERRLPAGTNFNYQDNALTWQPIVPADDGTQQLTLALNAAVAELAQPEHPIEAVLRHDGSEKRTSIATWIGLPPQPALSATPAIAAVGQSIQLKANPGGPGPFAQSWDLGDGRTVTAKDPVVVYPAPGTYQVTLQLANPLAVARATIPVTIIPQPTAAFTPDDARPVVQQPVQFVNESGGQPPLTYLWEFGDGATSTDANPTHQYTAPGTYQIRLLVQSEYGQAQTSGTVTVGMGPVADFVIAESAVTGQAISAQAFTDDTITALHWDTGDGRTYEGEAISHTYRDTGDFLVTLTASNDFGEAQVSKWVHVEPGIFVSHLPLVIKDAVPGQTAPAADAQVVEPPRPGTAPTAQAPAPDNTLPPKAPPATPGIILEEPAPAATPQPAAPTPQETGGAGEGGPEPAIDPITLPPQTPLPDTASEAEQLLWFINEARRLHGLPPVAYNYELSVAAQQHSVDMADHPGVMHQGSDGSRPAERQVRYGYTGTYAGEAVAWGFETAAPAVEFWVNSPPHRAILLNPYVTDVGVGFIANGRAPNIWYWTAEFGISPPEQTDLLDPDAPEPA